MLSMEFRLPLRSSLNSIASPTNEPVHQSATSGPELVAKLKGGNQFNEADGWVSLWALRCLSSASHVRVLPSRRVARRGSKKRAGRISFAMALVLTPAVVGSEASTL